MIKGRDLHVKIYNAQKAFTEPNIWQQLEDSCQTRFCTTTKGKANQPNRD